MKTVQKTIRLPEAVDKAIADMALAQKMEPADLMADVHSRFALQEESLGKEETQQVRAEIQLKEKARAMAQEICRDVFDTHVTLRVFQEIKKSLELRTLYEDAIGSEGNARGNHTKARINRVLGSIIKVAVGGTARTENGNRASIQVENEFVVNYTPLTPANAN